MATHTATGTTPIPPGLRLSHDLNDALTTWSTSQRTVIGLAAVDHEIRTILVVLADTATGVYVGMAIVFIYAVLGGMKGITYTQIAQYCVLIFAYTVPAIFISLNLTGNPLPQIGLGSTMSDGSGVLLLDKLDQVVTDLGFAAYTAQKGGTLNMFLLTMSLMIGTAGLPHVIIRFFTVPKVADARTSAGWALVFIAILYTTAPAVGAMARLNLIDTIQTGEIGSAQGNLSYEERPQWFRNWEKTGLLAFEDKNGDGRIQWYNDASETFAATAAALFGLAREASILVRLQEQLRDRERIRYHYQWFGRCLDRYPHQMEPQVPGEPFWI